MGIVGFVFKNEWMGKPWMPESMVLDIAGEVGLRTSQGSDGEYELRASGEGIAANLDVNKGVGFVRYDSISLEGEACETASKLKSKFAEAQAKLENGLRFDFSQLSSQRSYDDSALRGVI